MAAIVKNDKKIEIENGNSHLLPPAFSLVAVCLDTEFVKARLYEFSHAAVRILSWKSFVGSNDLKDLAKLQRPFEFA